MKLLARRKHDEAGFTIVEVVAACVVFSIIVGMLLNGLVSIRASYALARQYNEIYTVLSACPEIDRALEFSSLSGTNNCYPNNSFPAEDGGTSTISYSPNLTVTNTSALAASDPLYNIPDSKVLAINVGFVRPYTASTPLQLRMLITRNGIAQQ